MDTTTPGPTARRVARAIAFARRQERDAAVLDDLTRRHPDSRRVLMDRPRLRVTYTRRSRHGFMGRFGGGWQWALGFESGAVRGARRGTVIVNLLVAMVRFDWRRQ